MVRKACRQEQEAAGHFAFVARKQRARDSPSQTCPVAGLLGDSSS